MAVRPIDANALARKIREYMADFPNATARLTACRSILSMLGDENQMPTLSSFAGDNNVGHNGEPLTLEQLREMDGEPVWWDDGAGSCWGIISVDTNGRWAGIPFFRGRWKQANFEYEIESRGMVLYRRPPEGEA